MAESATPAVAILSYGRWVGLCPVDSNAMPVDPGQDRFECATVGGFGSCGTTADLTWPADPAAIALEVAGLPLEEQNWMP